MLKRGKSMEVETRMQEEGITKGGGWSLVNDRMVRNEGD